MSVITEGTYLGHMQSRLMHGPSGEELHTDPPCELKPGPRHFSPTDLVAGALGSCAMGYLGLIGERLGLDLTGMTVRVEKSLRSETPRRIDSLDVTLRLPVSVPEEARPRLEAAANSCPVRNSLHPDIRVQVRLCYDLPRSDPRA